MRDYPTVPNVFRVAFSQTDDTDCAAAAAATVGGCDIKITSGTNANLSIGQLRQQQQQKQKQQPNGNISGQQQSLVQSTSMSSQTNISQTTITTATPNSTALTPTTASILSTILKTSTSQPQQQQQQQNTKNDSDFIMQQHNSLQNQQQHHHKLTTHASIERPECLPTSKANLQQSPYATLPRNTASSSSTLSLMWRANDDSTQQQQQQEYHNSTNNNHCPNNKSNINIHKNHFNDPTMLGVINTISGSIPATGYTLDSQTAAKTNSNSNGGDANIGHHNISIGSDLNAVMNNSCTNLNKLNGVQQQQHLQQPQPQQQTTHQHINFKQTTAIDDFSRYRRQYPCSSLERNTNGYLWIITPVAASISVAIVIAALAGPQWLFTEEKLQNTLYNGTPNFNVLDDGALITRYTKSSLWIICTALQGVETYSCIKIDYFSEKGYQPDPHDPASAIPYTVTKSCPFFLASGIVLLLSFIVFLIPTCSHQNNLYYFSAGIMFIVSGLLMLIGLIAYISILKAEIGSKLRPRSTLQPPLFKVTYGQSFFLFVFGFIATEFVGLLNIFLYISLQEVGYYSHLPCFTISNLQEKIKEGENRFNSHTYKSYKHEIESKIPLERKRKQQNKKRQVTAQELELNTKKLLKHKTQGNGKSVGVAPRVRTRERKMVDAVTDANAGQYAACRKHPNGMSSTMFLNEMDRRYYFEKPSTSSTRSKCNLHSRNLAKSLNELYTESASSSALVLPPPPPSTIRAGGLQLQTQTLPRPPQQFSDSPQEFPLTRSVSTTTDIYATQNVSFSSNSNNINSKNNNRRRSVATNTLRNADTETQTNGSVSGAKVLLQQCNNNTHSKKSLPQQLQQLTQARHNKIYRTNFATTTTCVNDNDLVCDSIDTHNHRLLRRGAVNGHKVDGNNDKNKNGKDADDDDDHDVDDDEEVDEEQPQKLCGLKRSIRKTKDELFEEFCKRAGVRPKPKNIYFIDNNDGEEDVSAADDNSTTQQPAETEEEMPRNPLRINNVRSGNLHQRRSEETPGNQHKQQHQQHQQQQHAGDYHGGMENNRLFGDAFEVDDMDDEVDENGFKKLTENEDHLYVIDDNIHLMPQSIRSDRRASMCVEPNHLRRLNSNLSLHASYAPTAARASLQKSLYNLDTSGNEFGFLTIQQHPSQQSPYTMCDNTYGGSQQRLHHDYNNQVMYQSRTLPRTFMKRDADSQDSITTAALNASATQLHNMYSGSQQRLTALMMQHQQQLQQQNRYLSMSREQELYNSRYGLHKSNEELNRHYIPQQPIYLQPHQLQHYQQQQQQHANIAYNTISSLKQPPLVQWPAAIPSSPSSFNSSLRIYGPTTTRATENSANSNNFTTTITAGGQQVVNASTTGAQAPNKFQRAFAFDEPRRPSAVLADTFDFSEIEGERRRSNASLLTANTIGLAAMGGGAKGGVGVIVNTSKNQDHYDMINGTAV